MKTTSSLVVSVLLAAVGTAYAADPPGKAIYEGTCIACHGPDGKGALPGVPDFTAAKSPLSNPDAVLLKRITEGYQAPDSPMAMPPKGANPALTPEQIAEVLAYMRKAFQH